MDQEQNRQFEVLLTAQEAYPALERAFLSAETEIIAGFRIFDPWTKLLSDEAKAAGDTWFDLVFHTLNRGVKVSFTVSDFDPIARPELHKYAQDCVRALRAAGEASSHPQLLNVHAAMHPARLGWLPRLLLWPRSLKEINDGLKDINTQSVVDKQDHLKRAPRLRRLIKWQGDKLAPRLAPPPLVPVTHHQKLAVFDRERLYIGGLDLNNRRYDTPAHQRSAKETWHDCQIMVSGPVAEEAAQHLERFEAVCEGQAPTTTKHLLRTISAKRRFAMPFLSPKRVLSELADAHHAQIARAEQLIYFETQYFRDRHLADALAKRAAEHRDLSMILILPAAPEDAAFVDHPSSDVAYGEYLQAKSIDTVKEVFGDRLFIGASAQPRSVPPDGRATHYGAPIVYLHAKVSIFDEACGIVSSANLNGRSMFWDTETGFATHEPIEVAHLKTRCFDHWLVSDIGAEHRDSRTAKAAWSRRAAQNVSLPPEQRLGFVLPYSAGPGAALGFNLPGVPEEMA